MGERIATIATAVVTAVTVVAIATHPRTAGTVRAIGGTFVGALRQIVAAGGR
jgi:hypothetical protein